MNPCQVGYDMANYISFWDIMGVAHFVAIRFHIHSSSPTTSTCSLGHPQCVKLPKVVLP